jgi:hypothetical protein
MSTTGVSEIAISTSPARILPANRGPGPAGSVRSTGTVHLDPDHPGQLRQSLGGGDADPADRDHAAYRRGRVVGQHAPTADHDHPLRQGLDLLQVVAGQHDGAAVRVERLDARPQRPSGLDVQAGGRFVEEDDARPADERQRHREPPLLPAGQPTGLPVHQLAEAEPVEQFGAGERIREVGADEVDDLADPQRRRQPGLLRGDAERQPAPGVAGVAAAQLDPPRGGPAQPGEQVDQRRLAGTVRTEQADQLAGADVDADVVDGQDVAVSAADCTARARITVAP